MMKDFAIHVPDTFVVNCIGGPGVGKSTISTGVFSRLKQKGILCEYVSEHAKEIVYERKEHLLAEQEAIFTEQFRRQRRLVGQVKYIITDSPLFLSVIYFNRYWGDRPQDAYCYLMRRYYYNTFNCFENINFLINRNKPYVRSGRIQTVDEARQVDQEIRQLLDEVELPHMVTDSKKGIRDITNFVLQQEGVKKK